MNTTIITIAVGYIAFTALVLLTFRSMRDRNMVEAEYHNEEEQTN